MERINVKNKFRLSNIQVTGALVKNIINKINGVEDYFYQFFEQFYYTKYKKATLHEVVLFLSLDYFNSCKVLILMQTFLVISQQNPMHLQS